MEHASVAIRQEIRDLDVEKCRFRSVIHFEEGSTWRVVGVYCRFLKLYLRVHKLCDLCINVQIAQECPLELSVGGAFPGIGTGRVQTVQFVEHELSPIVVCKMSNGTNIVAPDLDHLPGVALFCGLVDARLAVSTAPFTDKRIVVNELDFVAGSFDCGFL